MTDRLIALSCVLCCGSGLLVTVDNRRNTRFRSMTWNALHQEWYLGDDAGFLTVWSIYRDALVKEQQVSDGPVTGVSQYDNPGTSLHAEVNHCHIVTCRALRGCVFIMLACSGCVSVLAIVFRSLTSAEALCSVK